MKESQLRGDFHSRAVQPVALATGLALSAMGVGCGPQDAANLNGTQPKSAVATASKQSALLGALGDVTIAAANTVINRYSKLAVDAAAGSKTVTIADSTDNTGLNVKAGDLIMVVQMQGATIDKTDVFTIGSDASATASTGYGDIMRGTAGKYEIAAVQAVDNATKTITLDFCGGLKNSYTVAGHSQVVWVPQYKNLTLGANGGITAAPWDGDKGGVVAAYVQYVTDLQLLNKGIDASGAGFRGGTADNSSKAVGMNVVTFRSKDTTDGAQHGEGIAGPPAELDANFNGQFARGASANAGGGGNSNGAGGGGGANQSNARTWTGCGVMNGFATAWAKDKECFGGNGNAVTNSSGGGRGGYSNSTALKDPTTVAPGSNQWAGDNRREAGGIGGRPVPNDPRGANSALFMGGGGGAGDGDDGAAGSGGNGGGLIYLVSGSFQAALLSGSITAQGNAGANTKAGTTGADGAGGGGGGGTMLVLAGKTLSTNLALNADGGAGGKQNLNLLTAPLNEADGPGGGGGGGFIATFSNQAAAFAAAPSAAGGNSGTTNSTAVLLFNPNGATDGGNGRADFKLTYADAPQMPVCVPSDLSANTLHTRGQVANGNTIQLTSTFKNAGPQPANTAHVFDTGPTGATIGTITWTCTSTGGAVCHAAAGTGTIDGVDDIPVQGTTTYVVNVPIITLTGTGIMYSSTTEVPPGYNDLIATNNTSSVTLMMNAQPSADFGLNVTAPTSVGTGQTIDYSFNVSNGGPGTATGSSFVFTYPTGSSITVKSAPTGWVCLNDSATTETCTYTPTGLGGVPPGALPPVVLTLTPPQGATDVMTSTTATATGVTDPVSTNNTVTTDTMIGNFPMGDCSIAVNSDPNPDPNRDVIKYDIRVANAGPGTATSAHVVFGVPVGNLAQNFDNSAAGWTCVPSPTGETVTCDYTQGVATGSLPDILISVQPSLTADSVTADARVTCAGIADTNTANDHVIDIDPITNIPSADLALTVTTSPKPAIFNMPVIYTLHVANNGPNDATGAVLVYNIPQTSSNVAFDASSNGWSCAQQNSQISCWFSGTIASNTSAPDIKITVTPTTGATQLVNTSTVTPKGATDANPNDNTVTTTTTLGDTGGQKLAGGGFSFGCSAVPTGNDPGAVSGLLASLLGLLGLRRRRRG